MSVFLQSFAGFAVLLFLPQLQGLTPPLLILGMGLVVLLRRDDMLARLRTGWWILLPGLFALASTLWSIAPGATFKASLELIITLLVAVWLGGSDRRLEVIAGLLAAGACYVLPALLLGKSVAIGNQADSAFAGFNTGKNLMGDIAAVLLLADAGVLMATWLRPAWLSLVLAGLGAIDFYVLLISRSAGALVGSLVAIGIVAGLVVLARLGAVARLVTMICAGIAAVPVTIVALFFGQRLVDFAFALFNKDATLTGRVYLWARAAEIIQDRPLLGVGYYAFWQTGNLDAEGIWTYARIASRSGFNFHNAMIENVVNIGYIGFGVVALTVLLPLPVLLYRAVAERSVPLAFWSAMVLYELSRVHIEAIGPIPFYYTTVLVGTALCAGLAPARGPARPVAPATRRRSVAGQA